MDRRSSDEWVARVVAWHNRHPLARRILPAQIQAMGWVQLPFTATGAASADTTRGRGWRAAFTEKFLPPFSPRRIARWALRHAQGTAPDTAGLPVREIRVDGRPPPADAQPVALWVATAAIVDGAAQTRVLLGPGAPRAVLGRRLWSRPRLTVVALTALLAVGGPSGVAWVSTLPWPESARMQEQQPVPETKLAQAIGPATPPDGRPPAPPLARPVALPVAPPVDENAQVPAQAPTPAEQAAAPAPARVQAALGDIASPGRVELPPRPTLAPLDTPARRGSVPLPPRGLALDETTKAAAREAAAAARAARAAVQAAAAPMAYAVAAPRVRTEAESALMRAALQTAVSQATPSPGCRVEVLPAGDDWRVVCWPFVHRADAERLREQLGARGHRLEVIDF